MTRRGLGVLWLLSAACAGGPARARPERPRLVLLLTIDQLRGDMPLLYADRFGPGGFRLLMERGTHYVNAHYEHACTETAVGHATLVTGGHPSEHGVVANFWHDPAKGRLVNCVEDDRHRILGAAAPRPGEGTSPRNLLSTTIGDELVLATGGRARVFGVSGKDRGAILPAGHAGKAFWFSRTRGEFLTSSYYYPELPGWAARWNASRPLDRYRGKAWDLLHDRSTYVHGAADDRPWEISLDPLGRTFPHPYGDGSSRVFAFAVASTPAGDDLTADFAGALLAAEGLGRGPATDLLAISFSSTDYVGHLFGPSSLEAEDNLLRLDRTLAGLFRLIDAKVGLDRTLIVLSSDHGTPEAPEAAAAMGRDAGRVDPREMEEGRVEKAVQARLGTTEDLIADYRHPYVYLNAAALGRANLGVEAVERVVAEELLKLPGIAAAVTRTDLASGRVPDLEMYGRVLRNFHPKRSGNVFVVQEPGWLILSPDEGRVATLHGSPWAYDTHVPILFAGPGMPAGRVSRRVGIHDIAPTLAAYLGIGLPSVSSGTPLAEVLP